MSHTYNWANKEGVRHLGENPPPDGGIYTIQG